MSVIYSVNIDKYVRFREFFYFYLTSEYKFGGIDAFQVVVRSALLRSALDGLFAASNVIAFSGRCSAASAWSRFNKAHPRVRVISSCEASDCTRVPLCESLYSCYCYVSLRPPTPTYLLIIIFYIKVKLYDIMLYLFFCRIWIWKRNQVVLFIIIMTLTNNLN